MSEYAELIAGIICHVEPERDWIPIPDDAEPSPLELSGEITPTFVEFLKEYAAARKARASKK